MTPCRRVASAFLMGMISKGMVARICGASRLSGGCRSPGQCTHLVGRTVFQEISHPLGCNEAVRLLFLSQTVKEGWKVMRELQLLNLHLRDQTHA
jgi:hypothetical protein